MGANYQNENETGGKGKKQQKKSGGKFWGGVLFGLILAALIVAALIYFGILGFGDGVGGGDDGKNSAATETKKEITLEIEVKQDLYLMEGKEVTMEEIKGRVTKDEEKVTVRLVNNYASTKAWDDLKNNLEAWNVTIVEE